MELGALHVERRKKFLDGALCVFQVLDVGVDLAVSLRWNDGIEWQLISSLIIRFRCSHKTQNVKFFTHSFVEYLPSINIPLLQYP